MAQNALLVAIVYVLLMTVDTFFISWQVFTRPIAIAPIVGLVLGDLGTGLVMGAALESLFMGMSAIGGAMPTDWILASTLTTAYVITSKGTMDMETGIALAMPIGAVLQGLPKIFSPLLNLLPAYWEKLAVKGNPKAFLIQTSLGSFIGPIINGVIVFFAMAYGMDGLYMLLAIIPGWLLYGITMGGIMSMAIGFALLTSMIWDWKIGVFFFVGFALVKYLNLGTMPIAIIATAVALTVFFLEQTIYNATKGKAAGKKIDSKEEFF